MVLFGVDLSHYRSGFDLGRAKNEGIEYVIAKATEGAGMVDGTFRSYLNAARENGLLFCAYHYQRVDASVASQVRNVRNVVPLDVPLAVDVEKNSGDVQLTRDLIHALQDAGYRVPLCYLPRWYWQKLGCPSLAGLPPLWSSRYPDNVLGSLRDEWNDVSDSWWSGYGGLSVAMLQFTSSALIANYDKGVDANAYRGTRNELAAFLGVTTEEDDMSGEGAAIIEMIRGSDRTAMYDGTNRNLFDALNETLRQVVLAREEQASQGQVIAGLQAAVTVLSTAVAANSALTAEDIQQAIRTAITDSTRNGGAATAVGNLT